MFRHEILISVTGEQAELALDKIREIEPDAYLEITFAIRHDNPDKWEAIEIALHELSKE